MSGRRLSWDHTSEFVELDPYSDEVDEHQRQSSAQYPCSVGWMSWCVCNWWWLCRVELEWPCAQVRWGRQGVFALEREVTSRDYLRDRLRSRRT